MSTFVTEEVYGKNRYRLEVWIDDLTSTTEFSSKELEGLRFDTLPKLIAAIKKKELDEKKEFKNPVAFMMPGYAYGSDREAVRQVTVTSLRDAESAWVTYEGGKRGVESLSNLYAKKEQVERYRDLQKAHQVALAKAHNGLEHWKPQR